MDCPFCGGKMTEGTITGDGRSGLFWKEGKGIPNAHEKLSGTGRMSAVQFSLAIFTVNSHYCDKCRKMVFDTEIKK